MNRSRFNDALLSFPIRALVFLLVLYLFFNNCNSTLLMICSLCPEVSNCLFQTNLQSCRKFSTNLKKTFLRKRSETLWTSACSFSFRKSLPNWLIASARSRRYTISSWPQIGGRKFSFKRPDMFQEQSGFTGYLCLL